MDRLARSCKDWYDLMERCTLFNTLLSDFDGVDDPTVFNDRLLLGLKAIMGEAELHLIRQRLYQGRMNKPPAAASCSLPFRWDTFVAATTASNSTLTHRCRPCSGCCSTNSRELGSACAVLRYLATNQILLGLRTQHGLDVGRLRWQPASRAVILKALRHPIYAGCYVYGLNQN